MTKQPRGPVTNAKPRPAASALMKKSSDQMIKLASIIEDKDDFRAALKQYMWSSCKACHSRYRAPH